MLSWGEVAPEGRRAAEKKRWGEGDGQEGERQGTREKQVGTRNMGSGVLWQWRGKRFPKCEEKSYLGGLITSPGEGGGERKSNECWESRGKQHSLRSDVARGKGEGRTGKGGSGKNTTQEDFISGRPEKTFRKREKHGTKK